MKLFRPDKKPGTRLRASHYYYFPFVLFTNDLAPTLEHVYALLYADDLKPSPQANLLSNRFMSPRDRLIS